MTYAYNTHGSPAVGGGLPGLPQRQAGGGGITDGGVIPVDAQFGYADEQPANAVEVGAIVEREDYPALSEMIPHTFEQTVQMPMGFSLYTATQTPVLEMTQDGKYLVSVAGATNAFQTFQRTGDSWVRLHTTNQTGVGTISSIKTTPDGLRTFIGSSQSTNPILVRNTLTGALITSIGGSNWPVKLLAVSPDGTLLAAASSTSTAGVERVKLWRRSGDTFTAVTLSVTTSAIVNGLCFSTDGKYLFVSASLLSLAIFDVSGATPVAIAHGLSLTGTFSMCGLPDGRVFMARLSGAVDRVLAVGFDGSNWKATYAKNQELAFAPSNASVLGNNLILTDSGKRVIVFTPADIRQRFPVNYFGAYEVAILESGDLVLDKYTDANSLNFGLPPLCVSGSADGKFAAYGFPVWPWLAVYGSESKMVARLNERSPTGQKLYIKG